MDEPGGWDCREVVRELYLFLDGELTDAKRGVIQHHLDDCSPCLEAFDFHAELRTVIASRCRDEVPVELRQRILIALQVEGLQVGGLHDGALQVRGLHDGVQPHPGQPAERGPAGMPEL